ncbi:hypothetical protein OGAPHI_003826 [Ogataea philodendri]|uniref:Uncharacterized protein n=1 Tax=Ogataea philodendri TaxID=1378263 RepID=A0A9P8P528_9ASCO|nr:uncharacterized protein OGAPHI_003826 [Ogataea philodendri]KAH3665638.1 hypothetical protein OGAPHI_003826 [Ogataea philodendri]
MKSQLFNVLLRETLFVADQRLQSEKHPVHHVLDQLVGDSQSLASETVLHGENFQIRRVGVQLLAEIEPAIQIKRGMDGGRNMIVSCGVEPKPLQRDSNRACAFDHVQELDQFREVVDRSARGRGQSCQRFHRIEPDPDDTQVQRNRHVFAILDQKVLGSTEMCTPLGPG